MKIPSNRSNRGDLSTLLSSRHAGSRFAGHLEKTRNVLLSIVGRWVEIPSIRSNRDDSSTLMSSRHAGSRFAGHLVKTRNV